MRWLEVDQICQRAHHTKVYVIHDGNTAELAEVRVYVILAGMESFCNLDLYGAGAARNELASWALSIVISENTHRPNSVPFTPPCDKANGNPFCNWY